MTGRDTVVTQAVRQIRELAQGAACSAAIRAAIKLELPEALGDEPATVAELAAKVGVAPEMLRRLLLALSCYDVFAQEEDGRYRHTATSRLLRADTVPSLKYNVLWATEPWTWELWPRLDEAIRSGHDVFQDLHGGQDFFSWLHAEDPASADVFDKAMTDSSRLSARAVAETLDVTGVRTVVDIAGGQGHVLATLLERHPDLRGVLYDLPEVVANADPRLREGGALAGRASLVGGDCLQEVPAGAELYVLKNILEWDDESTVRTLRNVVKVAPAGARVVLIENLVDGSPEMRFTTAMDLLLLLNVGGRKHTRDGLRDLVVQSGLEVRGIQPINSYLHQLDSVVPA